MSFADELARIRRLLRDPDGKIWDTSILRGFWNEIQHEVQIRTSILEDVTTIPIPPRFMYSFTYDWERSHTPKGSYRCFFAQEGHFSYTFNDEVQEKFDIEADTTQGGGRGSHPWEAWFSTPGYLPRIPFPTNFHKTKGFYFDEEPIEYEERKAIERRDPSWRSRTGGVISYTRESAEDNQFVLFPMPSSVTWDDESGEGMVIAVSGDSLNLLAFQGGLGDLLLQDGEGLALGEDDVGIFTQRTTANLSSEIGVSTEVFEAVDNVLLIYDIAPREVTGTGDDLDYPDFLTKYVRYGVLARAFMANTDGYIPSLANYWNQRYELGIKAIKKYRGNKTRDRNRVLMSENIAARRTRRHPRLPDGYPAT